MATGLRRGTIPPSLGSFASLEVLSLWGNQLEGSIPKELGDLSKLKHLELYGNRLSEVSVFIDGRVPTLGEIPSELAKLTELDSLWMWGNRFEGKLPSEMASHNRIILHLSEVEASVVKQVV
eukprot:scaffold236_cov419-Prasinococcus_capsulatus_cf.AAC.5